MTTLQPKISALQIRYKPTSLKFGRTRAVAAMALLVALLVLTQSEKAPAEVTGALKPI